MSSKIYINFATRKQLTSIPFVGDKVAKSIIAFRKANFPITPDTIYYIPRINLNEDVLSMIDFSSSLASPPQKHQSAIESDPCYDQLVTDVSHVIESHGSQSSATCVPDHILGDLSQHCNEGTGSVHSTNGDPHVISPQIRSEHRFSQEGDGGVLRTTNYSRYRQSPGGHGYGRRHIDCAEMENTRHAHFEEEEDSNDVQRRRPPQHVQSAGYEDYAGGNIRFCKPSTLPKNLMFDGKANWNLFKTKFLRYAQAARWSNEERRDALCWSVTGKAGEYYSLLMEMNENMSYRKILSEFDKRFRGDELPETLQAKFQSECQEQDEPLRDWADRILTLAAKAYKDLSRVVGSPTCHFEILSGMLRQGSWTACCCGKSEEFF